MSNPHSSGVLFLNELKFTLASELQESAGCDIRKRLGF